MLFPNISSGKKLKLLIFFTLAVSFVLCILSAILYKTEFSAELWIFDSNAVLLTLTAAVSVAAAFCVILFCALVLPKNKPSPQLQEDIQASDTVLSDDKSEEITENEAEAESVSDGEEEITDESNLFPEETDIPEAALEEAEYTFLEETDKDDTEAYSESEEESFAEAELENGTDEAEYYEENTEEAHTEKSPSSAILYPEEKKSTRIIAYLSGAAIVAVSALRFFAYAGESIKLPLPSAASFAMLLLSFIFALYFFPALFKNKNSLIPVFGGFCGVIFLGLCSMSAYMDMTIPIASEYRTWGILSLLLAMLFICADLRPRIAPPRPRFTIAITCIFVLVCAPLTVGRAVIYLTDTPLLSDEAFLSLITAFIMLYAISRLILAMHSPWNDESITESFSADALPIEESTDGEASEETSTDISEVISEEVIPVSSEQEQ